MIKGVYKETTLAGYASENIQLRFFEFDRIEPINTENMNKNPQLITLTFLLVLILILPFGNINKNCANAINPVKQNPLISFCGEKLNYTFKVSDKLIGSGVMNLTLEKNKIKGIATGLGMACQCNVDFNTNIEGFINKRTGNIDVTVCGIGDPIGILIPGKIMFNGPLKGSVNNKGLILSGKVNIKGKLATLGGFKNKEDILIEIQGASLANIFKKQLRDKLAFL